MTTPYAYAWLQGVFTVLVVVLVYYCVRRIRIVQEGYVTVIHRLRKFARMAGPGVYFLWPWEEEVAQIYVRQREASAAIPNVFTDGGLPVTVNVCYSYSLDPKSMSQDEIYYPDDDRMNQQLTLLKRVFQDLMFQMAQLQVSVQAVELDRVDVTRLFSPFAGPKAPILQTMLEPAVRTALRSHGIVVTDAPVLINGLTLPPEVNRAYINLLSVDFDYSARSDFIRRIRRAAPNVSEAGLTQLFDIIQNAPDSATTIMSKGTISTDELTKVIQTLAQPPSAEGFDTQPEVQLDAKKEEAVPTASRSQGQSSSALEFDVKEADDTQLPVIGVGPTSSVEDKLAATFKLAVPVHRLSGENVGRLHKALLSAFTNQDQLRLMVRIKLDENLNSIAGGTTLADITFSLIEWSIHTGRLTELIEAAVNTAPANRELHEFAMSLAE